MNKLPIARSRDIVVQKVEKETLIYDLITFKAYNLNETASLVYQACDGKTTFEKLKRKHGFNDEIIFLALEQLKKDKLIEVDDSYISPFAGMSRREVIRKAGIASMIALPVISSLVAPTAASAQSVDCSCVNPGNCLGKTRCPNTLNCNPAGQCAP